MQLRFVMFRTLIGAVILIGVVEPAFAQVAPADDLAAVEANVGQQVAAARTQYENMLRSLDSYIGLLKQKEKQANDRAKKRDQDWADYSRPLWAPPPSK